jgi:tRNA(Ile)-lysidine synthase
MLKKILHFIDANSLFAPGDTIVAAVSGGADSVALLDILVSLRELRLNLVVAHLNHLLRGAEAYADEEFVRVLAVGYSLPVEVRRVDIKEFARKEGRSLEDAGRVARYAFFQDVAALHNAHAVALAHHADDQAETVLMRLLRGSGGSGLCAMAPKSAGRYLRPLLNVTRGEIEKYLQMRGIAWRTDKSNDDADFLRNRIRHELIPFLAGYNPAISERLAATAEALAADEEFLEAATEKSFTALTVRSADSVTLDLPGVRSEPRAIRMRLYRRAIQQVKGDLARISYRHLMAIDQLVFSLKPHLTLTLPDGQCVAKSYDKISFAAVDEKEPFTFKGLYVDGPGFYKLPDAAMLSIEVSTSPPDLRSTPADTVYFDLDFAPFPWLVRTFRPGDRFNPFGMTGQKKVKELFIDAKIPVTHRPLIPLLFCGETIIWVGGIRRSDMACLTGRTKVVVRAKIEAP